MTLLLIKGLWALMGVASHKGTDGVILNVFDPVAGTSLLYDVCIWHHQWFQLHFVARNF
jgi:hypothetical protein